MTASAIKRFQTSALIDAANCPVDTFRAWRNRNGLFPETQGTAGWNKFSAIDIMITALVVELTRRGVMAQCAVNSAMSARHLLAKLSDVVAVERGDDVLELASELLTHWKKQPLPVLLIDTGLDWSPEVKLIEQSQTLNVAFDGHFTALIMVRLAHVLPFCMARLASYDAEFDYSSGNAVARETSVGGLKPPSGRAAKKLVKVRR